MKLKYRYYLQEGGGVKTIDSEEFPEELREKDVPRLTLAMLSAGIKEDRFENARKFFVDQGFLIRTPIFTDEKGVEYEGQNDEYRFSDVRIFRYYALRPSQGAQIMHDAITDGFDIFTNGGLGFAQNNRFFFDGIERNPQDFIGKQKPRMFGYSNVSNVIMLQDFIDYIHCPGLMQFPGCVESMPESSEKTLSIIRGVDVELTRQTIAVDDRGCELIEKLGGSDLKVRSYPINVSTFFGNNYNSDFAFTAPKEDYSLMLESIVWFDDVKDIERSLMGLRKFLQRMKENGQKLPLMVEIGNFTEASITGPGLAFEYGRVMTDGLSKEQELDAVQKSRDYENVIKKICDDFEIAFFVGGEKRIGHALDNQVQPSNSICEVVQGEDGISFTIKSSLNPRSKITGEDIARITEKKKMPKLDVEDLKSVNVRADNPRALFGRALEPSLLSGKLHEDGPPLDIVLVGEGQEGALQKARKMVQAFCKEHEVAREIAVSTKDKAKEEPSKNPEILSGGAVKRDITKELTT